MQVVTGVTLCPLLNVHIIMESSRVLKCLLTIPRASKACRGLRVS